MSERSDPAAREVEVGPAARGVDVAPAGPTPPRPDAPRARRRLDGVDIARGLAILGMVTVHFGPFPVREEGPAAWIYGSFYGKASVLFVLVAGVGVGLSSDRRAEPQVARGRMLYRTAWLLPLGLWLQTLQHPVAVILQYYAIYFLALVPFVGRSDRTILGWAAGGWLGGALAVLATYVLVPEWVVPYGGDSPWGVAGDLVLFGYYPVVTWVPPMLLGVWLGRRDLRDDRLLALLVVAGVAVLVGTTLVGSWLQEATGGTAGRTEWRYLFTTVGHSEMPLAVAGATGLAVAVVGAASLLARRFPRVLWPLTALGRLALSVYVGHLLVFHVVPTLFPSETVAEGIATVLAFGAVAAAASVAWLAVFPRGPLEAVVRWPWERVFRPILAGSSGPRPDR